MKTLIGAYSQNFFTLKTLSYSALAIVLCLAIHFLYEYELIRYIWLFCVFWVSSVHVTRFFIDLIIHKSFEASFFLSSLFIVGTAIYWNYGSEAVIFGIGIGVTFYLALLIAHKVPLIEKKIQGIFRKK